MKKLLKSLALTMLVTISLVSCSKSDDGPSTSGQLIGKWEYFQEGVSVNGQEQLDAYEHAAGCNKDFLEFTTTNVISTSYFGSDCLEEVYSDPYTRSGSTLTSNGDSVTIIQLDNSTLKIKGTYIEQGITTNFITVFKRK